MDGVSLVAVVLVGRCDFAEMSYTYSTIRSRLHLDLPRGLAFAHYARTMRLGAPAMRIAVLRAHI